MTRGARAAAVGRFRETPATFYGEPAGTDSFPGSAAMTRIVAMYIDRLRPAFRPWNSTNSGNNGGWLFQWDDAPRWVGGISDGAGNAFSATVTRTPVLHTIEIVSLSFDGTTITTKVRGLTEGTAVVGTVGFTASGREQQIGVRTTQDDRPSTPVIAALGTDNQALTAAELETAMDEIAENLRQGRALDTGLAVFSPEVYFDAADVDFLNSEWVDRIGGITLDQNGQPERFGVSGAL